jgi:hypothetical protein
VDLKGVTSMLATLDSSSVFFSGSCGDFAVAGPAKSKPAGNRQAMETSPFDSKERLLIDNLTSALGMIAFANRSSSARVYGTLDSVSMDLP